MPLSYLRTKAHLEREIQRQSDGERDLEKEICEPERGDDGKEGSSNFLTMSFCSWF